MATNVTANVPTETPMSPPEASVPLNVVNTNQNVTEISNEPVAFADECNGTHCSHMRPWSSELNIPQNLTIADAQLQYKKINSEHSFSVGVLQTMNWL